jgi:hypothetical protein
MDSTVCHFLVVLLAHVVEARSKWLIVEALEERVLLHHCGGRQSIKQSSQDKDFQLSCFRPHHRPVEDFTIWTKLFGRGFER